MLKALLLTFALLFVVPALAAEAPTMEQLQTARAQAAEARAIFLEVLLERTHAEALATADYWKAYVAGLGKR